MKAICVSAISSNQGKTLLTTALLHHFKKSVRAYKIGPDYIDPQFHEIISSRASINLDTFIMNENQVKWIFNKYNDQNISILEGVMGFYDGMDKGSSAYDVTKLLNIPTILLLDGSGSYITISAVLKGLKTYKENNTIKAVILNKLSSSMHYELIKNQIEKDRSVADEKNCIRHTLVFLCCVILDNRESVYIASLVLFLYNIEINYTGKSNKTEEKSSMAEEEFQEQSSVKTETEKEQMSELKRFYVEKFEGNVLREFYPEGALKSEAEVKEGKRHGRYREYYEDGTLKLRGKYANNKPKGTWKYYTEDGKFERKEKF